MSRKGGKKKKGLKDAGLDIEDKDARHRFMDWVAQGSIPRALDVRKLPKVLQHDETKELLEAGEGQQAFARLALYDASESSPRFAAIERMNRQLTRMTWEDYRMIDNSDAHKKLIRETITRLEKTLDTVENMDFGE